MSPWAGAGIATTFSYRSSGGAQLRLRAAPATTDYEPTDDWHRTVCSVSYSAGLIGDDQ